MSQQGVGLGGPTCAQQRAVRVHCACNKPATVHFVVHCLSHCTWTLFMGTVKKNNNNKIKRSTKMTPGNWGVTAWYQSLGIRRPKELGFRCP